MNGTLIFIKSGKDQTGVIQNGNDRNHIVGDCRNDTLTLIINDTQLLQAQDTEFSDGAIGLVAGLPGGQGLYVVFDYFIAKE